MKPATTSTMIFGASGNLGMLTASGVHFRFAEMEHLMGQERSICSRFWEGTGKQEGISDINKMDLGSVPPKLRCLATSSEEVEDGCSLENQTTTAEERFRNKGMNKFTVQQELTASSILKMKGSPIKDSTPKETSSSVHVMSGVGTLKQPIDLEPLVANNVKHATSSRSTSRIVNRRVAKTETLPSIEPSELMRCISDKDKCESFQEHPKRPKTEKVCCNCHQLHDKPPKKTGDLDDDYKDLLNAAHSAHSAREQACSDPFWKTMESFFAPITHEDRLFLKSALYSPEEHNQSQTQAVGDECHALDIQEHNSYSGGEESSMDQHSASSFQYFGFAKMSSAVPSSYQRALSALIVEGEGKGLYNPNEGRSVPFQPMSIPTFCGSSDFIDPSFKDREKQDGRLLQELHNIGLYPETMPHSEDKEVSIDQEIKKLEEQRCQQAATLEKYLEKIVKAIQSEEDLEKRNTEESALDELTTLAYKKTMAGRRRKHTRSVGPKLPKKAASALIMRTLARCKEFEATGRSCFSQPSLQGILFSAPPAGKDAKPIQYNGCMIRSSKCNKMHSKETSRASGSIEGLTTL